MEDDNKTIELIKNIQSTEDVDKKNFYYEELIILYDDLIKEIANSNGNTKLDKEDVMQLTLMSFIESVNNFDVNKKVNFKSYIIKTTNNKIKKAIDEELKDQLMSESLSKTLNEILDKEVELERKYKRIPTEIEVANALNLSLIKLHEYKAYAYEILLIDSALRDTKKPLKEIIALSKKNSDEVISEDETLSSEMIESIELSLNNLNEKEREIIKKFYGLSGYEKRSIDELKTEYNISKEKIRQILKLALNKLRRELEE